MQGFEKIYAPFDGVITARKTEVGDLINAGNSGVGAELFRISNIGTMRVYVNVPEVYSDADCSRRASLDGDCFSLKPPVYRRGRANQPRHRHELTNAAYGSGCAQPQR